MDTIGVVCEPDHPVFGRVAERLAARGFGVEFLPPRTGLSGSAVADFDAFVNTVLSPRSFALLRRADRADVETWNGFGPTAALSARTVGLYAIERLGCRVPETTYPAGDAETAAAENPEAERTGRAAAAGGPTVARPRFRWEDPATLVGENGAPVGDDETWTRYYAVDDGVETHVQARTLRHRLSDQQATLTRADVDVQIATRVRELIDRFDARTVAVDFAQVDGEWYALDVDPAPQFYDAGMKRRIADSMASLTTIGA